VSSSTVAHVAVRARLEPASAYQLRHVAATAMRRAGVPPSGISQLLRHQHWHGIPLRTHRPRRTGLRDACVAGGRLTTGLRGPVRGYLALRRAVGFKMEKCRAAAGQPRWLPRGRPADDRDHAGGVAWAILP
jgi:hypothetical protein